jgi:hypothetical protein
VTGRADTEFGPAECPVCGSVGVRAWMLDHIESEHGTKLAPIDHMRESRIARARGLAQAIAGCRDDARMDGIREGAAEIVALLATEDLA